MLNCRQFGFLTELRNKASVDAKESTLTVNGYTYRVSKVVYGNTPLALTVVQPNMMVKVDENIQKSEDGHAVVSLEPTITG
ncbi:hypothetical protein [Vibrio parahaemolyticus]|uniref:hypothetical protein n=1 Tax=Vibrio parahaemolyticus TaxID=670 RepID=UPI0007B8EB1B|nr:hypothetical protein [Vibrio parahaemolyticus]ELA7420851.1 hypothetical protein [Vibrio parahaemolyticus]